MALDFLTTTVREAAQNTTSLPQDVPPPFVFSDVERLMADLYRAQPALHPHIPQSLSAPWYRTMGTQALGWLRENNRTLAGGTAAAAAALTAPVSVPVIIVTLTVVGGAIVIGGYTYANLKNPPDWFGQQFADWLLPVHDTVWLPSSQLLTVIQLPGNMSGVMNTADDDPRILPFKRRGPQGVPQNQVNIEMDPTIPNKAYIGFWRAPLKGGQLEPGAEIVFDEEGQWNGFDLDLDKTLEEEGWSGPENEREGAYERVTRRIIGSVGIVVERQGRSLRIRFQRGHTDKNRNRVSVVIDRVGNGEISGVEIHFDPALEIHKRLGRIP